MTSNLNFDAKPILIALCGVNQPLNRKITKIVLRVILRFRFYHENHLMEIIPVFWQW